MWEERNCRQVRQWQHWGSGCYRYRCESGRLHIIVGNYTYTCFYTGQEITIRIMANGWLRKGAIRCPPCNDLCREKFAALGQTCRLSEESFPANLYPKDELLCGSVNVPRGSFFLITLVGLFLAMNMSNWTTHLWSFINDVYLIFFVNLSIIKHCDRCHELLLLKLLYIEQLY